MKGKETGKKMVSSQKWHIRIKFFIILYADFRRKWSSPNSGVNSNPDKIPVKRLQETASVKEQFPEVLFLLRQLPFLAKIYETSFFLKEAHHYNQLRQLP